MSPAETALRDDMAVADLATRIACEEASEAQWDLLGDCLPTVQPAPVEDEAAA